MDDQVGHKENTIQNSYSNQLLSSRAPTPDYPLHQYQQQSQVKLHHQEQWKPSVIKNSQQFTDDEDQKIVEMATDWQNHYSAIVGLTDSTMMTVLYGLLRNKSMADIDKRYQWLIQQGRIPQQKQVNINSTADYQECTQPVPGPLDTSVVSKNDAEKATQNQIQEAADFLKAEHNAVMKQIQSSLKHSEHHSPDLNKAVILQQSPQQSQDVLHMDFTSNHQSELNHKVVTNAESSVVCDDVTEDQCVNVGALQQQNFGQHGDNRNECYQGQSQDIINQDAQNFGVNIDLHKFQATLDDILKCHSSQVLLQDEPTLVNNEGFTQYQDYQQQQSPLKVKKRVSIQLPNVLVSKNYDPLVIVDNTADTVTDFNPSQQTAQTDSTETSLPTSSFNSGPKFQEISESTTQPKRLILSSQLASEPSSMNEQDSLAMLKIDNFIQRVKAATKTFGTTDFHILQTLHICSGKWSIAERLLALGSRKISLRELYFTRRDDAILYKYIDQEYGTTVGQQLQLRSSQIKQLMADYERELKNGTAAEIEKHLGHMHLLDFQCKSAYDEQYWSASGMATVRGQDQVLSRIEYLRQFEKQAVDRMLTM